MPIGRLTRAVRKEQCMRVSSLLIYPVKSIGGVAVDTASIDGGKDGGSSRLPSR
jgi:hypothetical protein